MSATGAAFSAPVQVIPPTDNDVPLRTFIFFFSFKGDPSCFHLFRAESREAICEWWCQGGGGKDAPEWDDFNNIDKTPRQLLELIDDWSSRSHYVLEEIVTQPILIPTNNQIRAELNEYLLPELTNIILKLTQARTVEEEDEEEESDEENNSKSE